MKLLSLCHTLSLLHFIAVEITEELTASASQVMIIRRRGQIRMAAGGAGEGGSTDKAASGT